MVAITRREQINRKIAAGVTKMTPVIIEKLKQAFAFDCTIEEAALYAGIHPSTYHNWVKRHPELLDQFEQLRKTPILAARRSVVNGLRSDTRLALDYLTRKRPEEFGTKTKVELGGKIQTEDVTNAPSLTAIQMAKKAFQQALYNACADKRAAQELTK